MQLGKSDAEALGKSGAIGQILPSKIKETFLLRAFGFLP